MQKRISLMSSLALAVCLGAPLSVQSQETADAPDPNRVMATVDGVDITLAHMIVAMASLPQQYQDLEDQVLFDGILQQLIQQAALANSFDGDVPARITAQLENERRSLLAAEMVEEAMSASINEVAVQRVYDAQFGSMDPQPEFNASHILVATEEEAIAIKAELDEGADFAELARDKSTGPSGPNGGNLGWFGPGMMVPSFEEATLALEVGDISNPVETQFGWHVITLLDTRQQEIPTLDTVREQIETQIAREAAEASIEATTNAANVVLPEGGVLDPSVIRNLDLLVD